ncbi:hypothetical protein [Chelativorans salis]|uniref:Uncharacterized protein n=1 Tax=Chelativorans salis TaxID=2978478 RepID=A0ABT2LKF9_9HYPH|nr:hypothetical protein [Chelativorans sp. EGI FJ00035]MCT7374292.1 hypothetical protein [Chelativorans sp. EGI FJ00035]
MRTPTCTFPIAALALFLPLSGPAAAQEDSDWPCIQRLVPRISPAQVWGGPAPNPEEWQGDAEISRLASQIAARRLSVGEAEELIDAFATAQDRSKRDDRLTALFGRTLEIINADRASIIAGIKRFTERQRQMAERIRENRVALDETEADEREDLSETLQWDIRIFNEREQALNYLCEQPVLLEQRAFSLGSTITSRLGESD